MNEIEKEFGKSADITGFIYRGKMEKRVPGLSRLLVQKVDEERKSKGGIVLADTFESTTQTCIILSVGECKGKYEAGHYAYINRHAGVEVGMDELIILEGDILMTEDRI